MSSVRVGILGGGQLARMLALACYELGMSPHIFAKNPSECACQVSQNVVIDDGTDGRLKRFINGVDVLTIENEFIDLERYGRVLSAFPKSRIYPTLKTLSLIQNKSSQKVFLKKKGIPTLPFAMIHTSSDLRSAYKSFSGRLVVKKSRLGYDGRGTFVFNGLKDRDRFSKFVKTFRPADSEGYGYAEPLANFTREIAVVGARSLKGEFRAYDPVETYQVEGQCLWARSPALLSRKQNRELLKWTKKIMSSLQAVGVFAVEYFLLKNGQFCVNEIAPRVHNSGHWTLNGCPSSQFQEHLRAVMGLPLASTQRTHPIAMVNILGQKRNLELTSPEFPGVLGGEKPETWIHWYGKTGFSFKRKLGHINAFGGNINHALTRALAIRKKVKL